MIDLRAHGGKFGGAKNLYGIFDPVADAPLKDHKLALHIIDISPYVMLADSQNYMVLGTPNSDYNAQYNLRSCVNLRLHDKKTGVFIRNLTNAFTSAYGYSISYCIIDEALDRVFSIIYKNYPGQSPQFDAIVRANKISDGTIVTETILQTGSGPTAAIITQDAGKKFLVVSAGRYVKFVDPLTLQVIQTKDNTYQPCTVYGCDQQYIYHYKANGSGGGTAVKVRYDDSSFTETALTGTTPSSGNPQAFKFDPASNKLYILQDTNIAVIDTVANSYGILKTFGTNVNIGTTTIPWNGEFLTAGYLNAQNPGSSWIVGTDLSLATTDASSKRIALPQVNQSNWLRMASSVEFIAGYMPADKSICFNLVLANNAGLPTTIKRILIKKS